MATTASTAVPQDTSSPAVATATPVDGAILAEVVIDDRPPPTGYVRDLFPTWLDTDHDGCDARQQALAVASDPPAKVEPGCKVTAGTWSSDYDGQALTRPEDVDIDHVVPLADAWRSGAAAWTTDQRALLANDQANLWPVSASSNRSKADGSPDRWRPPRRDVWCTYAVRWIRVKVAWRLTATTPERDALGQMLDTCAPDPPGAPAPTEPATPTTAGYVASCAAARAAGIAPLHRGEPGYREDLDGDRDGIACEQA